MNDNSFFQNDIQFDPSGFNISARIQFPILTEAQRRDDQNIHRFTFVLCRRLSASMSPYQGAFWEKGIIQFKNEYPMGWYRFSPQLTKLAISIAIDHSICKQSSIIDDVVHFLDFLLSDQDYFVEIHCHTMLYGSCNPCHHDRHSKIVRWTIENI